jgi:hypothetical protein
MINEPLLNIRGPLPVIIVQYTVDSWRGAVAVVIEQGFRQPTVSCIKDLFENQRWFN